ncbi:ParB N-terminal domain-containing protein [Nitrosomonas sp. Is37]|uniref:ParB N-terminal domain-containing protein n=1 Tax=Nitrosomonas sp. Is37 TaxID=3080535 RepID=UPI00294A9BB7|nr:ParB N-terminal domain-containing protein [Nitrosomonas sp. Is37]MDV6344216.1 ParB N-terminal domain-containing protein [Nitrosomonas sp. Is37]
MLRKLSIHLVPIGRIRPSELHDPQHAIALADTIQNEGIWRIPVTLERHSLAVMDGHHRVAAAHLLKLKFVPCVLLDYNQVEVSATRPGYLVTPQEIVRRAQTEEPYPPKTTFHRFLSPLPTCDLSLSLLADEAVIKDVEAG